jgi:hypothetical protein
MKAVMLKVSAKERRAWREQAEAALKKSANAEVELMKELPKKNSCMTPAPPKVGDQMRLDERDSASPFGVVTGARHGAARLVLDAQDVLDWLESSR